MASYDWKQAGALFERALESGNNGAIAGMYGTNYLLPLGRITEAVEVVRRTMRQDPLNYGLVGGTAWQHSHVGRDNAFALEQLDRLAAAGQDITPYLCMKAGILALLERREEALETLNDASSLGGPWEFYACAQANYSLGRLDQFNVPFAKLKDGAADQFGARVALYSLYSVIGDLESWLPLANEFIDNQEVAPLYFRTYQDRFGDKAADPRYQALLKAVRLDDASLAEMGMVWGEPEVAE